MRKKTLDAADSETAVRLRKIWDQKKIELRLTQEKAADLLGFSTQASVSHYLNGTTPLNTDAVLKFSALLGVKPEEIRPDLADLMNYVRKSGEAENDFSGPGWRLLTPDQSKLVELYDRLPQSEKEKHIASLELKVDDYDRLFKELLAARKQ
jgi:transcriptional regulator with XRE-family HTH domain